MDRYSIILSSTVPGTVLEGIQTLNNKGQRTYLASDRFRDMTSKCLPLSIIDSP